MGSGFHPRSLAPGAAVAAAAQVALTIAGAIATVAVARMLGPEGVGAYAVATAFLLLLTSGATLGLESGIVFRVGSGLWAPRRAWAETQLAALALGLLGASAGVGIALLVPSAFAGLSLGLVALLAFSLPFGLSWIYAASVAVARDRYEDYALPSLAQALVVAVGAVVLTAAFGLSGAVASLALAHVVAAAVLALRSRRALRVAAGTPASEGNLRAAAGFGLKTYGANALQLLNYRLDLFVLNAVAAGAVVGRYSIAVAVTSLVWLLPRALSAVLLPRVAALAGHEDREAVEAKSVRHAVVLVAVSAVGVGGGLLLVPLVYGATFGPAIGLGLIILPGAALLGVANVLMATVVGRGRPGLSLAGSLVSVPVTAALYLLLIPPFGAPAAALASSLSYALSFALAAFFYRRVTGAGLRARLVPTRDELEDYRRLWVSVRAARRARGGPSGPTNAPASAAGAPRPEPAGAPGSPGRPA